MGAALFLFQSTLWHLGCRTGGIRFFSNRMLPFISLKTDPISVSFLFVLKATMVGFRDVDYNLQAKS